MSFLNWLIPIAALCAVMASSGLFETPAPNTPPQALMSEAALGKRAFGDPTLSVSGGQSCASCHAAGAGHAAPNTLPVQPGGASMQRRGLRAAQTLGYLATNGPFRFDEEGKAVGGFFWDGRADSLATQAAGPLLGPVEMAHPDAQSLTRAVARATWAPAFRARYGERIFDDPQATLARLTQALARHQVDDPSFNAFSSKFDAVLRGQAQLTAQEARGLELFNSADKGNCAECHPSAKRDDGGHPLFTDFSYDTLGVPRNADIPANADAAHFDLGLCGRPDLRHRKELCGAFKVPTLRNVALRQVYFHNGRFNSLRDTVVFYVQRDTHPEKWYPRDAQGRLTVFDDLPKALHGNVNREAPYDRKPGQQPALSDAEVDDVVAFMGTLTDGWVAR
jgi:cytochrome c peroxidase